MDANAAQSRLPLVSVVIPVGGNRTHAVRSLFACVEAILGQGYPNVEVLLIIDPENVAVRDMCFSHPDQVRLVPYQRPPGSVGRDTILRFTHGWDCANGQILASTGVSLVWSPGTIHTAMLLMRETGVQAVDGILRRLPGAHDIVSAFQDDGLFGEFRQYKHDHILTGATLGNDSRLPTLSSFFMTRGFYDRVRLHLPTHFGDGWDDYNLVCGMIEAGGEILCTNQLIAYRTHKPSLRLSKQFSSGVAGAAFLLNHWTNPYARKRLHLAILAWLGTLIPLLCLVAGLASNPRTVAPLSALTGSLLVVLMGVYNAVKVRDARALVFPPVTALQIAIWVVGYVYTLANDGNVDKDLMRWLHAHR